MANDISGSVWRIDTLPFSYAYRVKITDATWSDQANVGDQIVATQASGTPLFDTKAQQINFQQNLLKPMWVNGITVTKLDSGVLNIAVGAGK